MLPILFQDEHLVAINKPHGLLVHRSPLAADASEFAVQLLRDQLGRKVFPVHRLDRKTSGILLFALDETTNVRMQRQFAEGSIDKKYLAIVRGYTEDTFEIDYPLTREDGATQEAFTAARTLGRTEIPVAFGKHPTSRYSLVELSPTTGRMHQLRRHMAHVFHPIIGDRPHGCNKQNRFFKEHFNHTTMLLHAAELQVIHPETKTAVHVRAPLSADFERIKKLLDL
ncbi:pseudouridine synthase [Arundinibacter roseus]|uniref:tRNA pseudouridine synthase C n=1 Tax=Arundinibacter roseus TaxID=2070510 RepID=A0A4R4KNJ6_9BACT|nr:pseudouridine synthase [Arundinibacter roseus]TDB68141.1 pseudouridylate synthase [Arundinibacter roseus]